MTISITLPTGLVGTLIDAKGAHDDLSSLVEHAVTAIRVGMDSSRAIKQDEQFKEVRAWLAAANGIEQVPLF